MPQGSPSEETQRSYKLDFPPSSLHATPNALAPFYSQFQVAERLLLTGHSHQAWPDRALIGQTKAWSDAAQHVDRKWHAAFEKAKRVRSGFATLLNDTSGHYALAPNTHELLVRFLSALPLRKKPRLITTDGEFHTIRRQLDRLAEEGIEIVRVRSSNAADTASLLAKQLTPNTAAVLVSSVSFLNGHILQGLDNLASACRKAGVPLLVDAYHHLNVLPFSTRALDLEDAFVIGGGYKYCQLGEGNCFLRFPKTCDARPAITGWFAEFDALEAEHAQSVVAYGRSASRFEGATYDPTSHYRACEVFDFFQSLDLQPAFLRVVSQHQIDVLMREFDHLGLPPKLANRDRQWPLDQTAGFLAIKTPRAAELCNALAQRGVLTDSRADILRFGPAPYLSDQQLRDSIRALGEAARSLP